MRKPLKALIVEDREMDAELMVVELRHQYIVDWVRVETEEQFLRELAKGPDVVIADYSLPRFSGVRAMEILRATDQATPFVLVSGKIPEEEAAALMNRGVTDYVLKSSLVRLGPAIERALEQKQTVQAKAEVEDLYHQTETRYKALFEQAVEAVMVLDAETGVVLEANPRAAVLFGRDLADIVGSPGADLVPSATREQFVRRIASLGGGGVSAVNDGPRAPANRAQIELVIERPDGTTAEVDMSATIVRVAENRSVVQAFLRDVTERNQLQAEIAAQRDRLEETVKQRTAELQATVATLEDTVVRLEEASRHKSQFLRHMSHELRTPLNSILGFTDMLTSGFCGHLTAQQMSYVQEIESAGTHLLQMIGDLLDLARIDSGSVVLEPSPFPPSLICESVCGMLAAQTREKRLHLRVEHDPRVGLLYADLQKARQIMLNLLSNAVKFTPSGGAISIQTEQVDDDWVRISVSDTGCGIAATDLPHIFEEFYQANRRRDQAMGGTGIGLALTKRLVELHGGTITVESAQGEGTTFRFTLPAKPMPAEDRHQAATAEPSPSTVGQLRILLVSDDNQSAQVLETAFRAIQHRVVRATSCEEAATRCGSDAPDAVVLDLIEHEEEALALAARLRADTRLRNIAVVFITSDGSDERAAQAEDSGCDDCLLRPVQPSIIVNEVVRIVGRHMRAAHSEAAYESGDC